MKKYVLALLPILGMPVESVYAKDNQFMAWGLGKVSCATYTQEMRNPENAALYGQWIHGFITALNIHDKTVVDYTGGVDRNGLLAWLVQYCEKHPVEAFANATDSMIEYLVKANKVQYHKK